MSLACITHDEAAREQGWLGWLEALAAGGRATRLRDAQSGADFWVALERLACLQAAYPDAVAYPSLSMPDATASTATKNGPRRRTGRDHACAPERLRPATAGRHRRRVGAAGNHRHHRADAAGKPGLCDARPLHARRHRRGMVRAPSAGAHPPLHHQEPAARDRAGRAAGLHALSVRVAAPGADTQLQRCGRAAAMLAQLEGYEAAAGAWESELLARACGLFRQWLDDLCRAGKSSGPASARRPARPAVRCAARRWCCCRAASSALWHALPAVPAEVEVSPRAARVLATLRATAPCSSTSWRTTPVCCRWNWKIR
jgi:ATP-dependent Lhr-like helicase